MLDIMDTAGFFPFFPFSFGSFFEKSFSRARRVLSPERPVHENWTGVSSGLLCHDDPEF